MNKSKIPVGNDPLKNPVNFARDLARYREVLAEMDEVKSVSGKRRLFIKLTCMLAEMKTGIWSEFKET